MCSAVSCLFFCCRHKPCILSLGTNRDTGTIFTTARGILRKLFVGAVEVLGYLHRCSMLSLQIAVVHTAASFLSAVLGRIVHFSAFLPASQCRRQHLMLQSGLMLYMFSYCSRSDVIIAVRVAPRSRSIECVALSKSLESLLVLSTEPVFSANATLLVFVLVVLSHQVVRSYHHSVSFLNIPCQLEQCFSSITSCILSCLTASLFNFFVRKSLQKSSSNFLLFRFYILLRF